MFGITIVFPENSGYPTQRDVCRFAHEVTKRQKQLVKEIAHDSGGIFSIIITNIGAISEKLRRALILFNQSDVMPAVENCYIFALITCKSFDTLREYASTPIVCVGFIFRFRVDQIKQFDLHLHFHFSLPLFKKKSFHPSPCLGNAKTLGDINSFF